MLCSCGHPAHHHTHGHCFTVTVTGPPSEIRQERTETICDCITYEANGTCANCNHPTDIHFMDYGHCQQPMGETDWVCGCLHYEKGEQ